MGGYSSSVMDNGTRTAFAGYAAANPGSKAVLEDLWRHMLAQKVRIGFVRPPLTATPAADPDESQRELRAMFDYACRPMQTYEEMDRNYRANCQRELDEFDGF